MEQPEIDADQNRHADKAKLLGKDRSNVIVLGLWQVAELLHTFGRASAQDTTRAGCNLCLVRLVAFALEIKLGVEIGGDPSLDISAARSKDP